jgi:hypothetical protein
MAPKTKTGIKQVPPKKAPGKRDAHTGTSNEWATKAIQGIRKRQRTRIVKGK